MSVYSVIGANGITVTNAYSSPTISLGTIPNTGSIQSITGTSGFGIVPVGTGGFLVTNGANTQVAFQVADSGASASRTSHTVGSGSTGGHLVTSRSGVYSDIGVPSFSAPSGSLYLRFDGAANARLYINTSAASTSGTTWSALTTP